MTRKSVSRLLCALAIAFVTPAIVRSGGEYFQGGMRAIGEGRYEAFDRDVAEANGVQRIRIISPDNLRGNLTVRATTSDSVTLNTRLVMMRIPSEKTAELVHQAVATVVERDGDLATVRISTESRPVWGGTDYGVLLEGELTIPPNCAIQTDTRFFNVLLQGPCREVSVKAEYGQIRLYDISSPIDVTGEYTEIDLRDISGRINVETSYASLTARNILAEGTAQFRNEHGPISVADFEGFIDARTSTGTIDLTRARLLPGGSALMSKYAPIRFSIDSFEGASLYVETGTNRVDGTLPRDLSARVVLEIGRGGQIETTGLPIRTPPDNIGRNRLEGICGEGDGHLEVTVNGSGGIALRGE